MSELDDELRKMLGETLTPEQLKVIDKYIDMVKEIGDRLDEKMPLQGGPMKEFLQLIIPPIAMQMGTGGSQTVLQPQQVKMRCPHLQDLNISGSSPFVQGNCALLHGSCANIEVALCVGQRMYFYNCLVYAANRELEGEHGVR